MSDDRVRTDDDSVRTDTDQENLKTVGLGRDSGPGTHNSDAPLAFEEIIERLKSGQWGDKQRRPLRKRVLMVARQLHVFSSSLMLVLLLGFALTGWLLNHQQWLSGSAQQGAEKVALPAAVQQSLGALDSTGEVPLTAIQRALKAQFGLETLKDFQWDRDFSEVVLNYDLPAGYATVILNYAEEDYQIQYRQGGFWSVMNDLHKGRHSGPAWSWLIDISAWMMIFFAVSGLVILWQNKKSKVAASWLLVLGLILPLVIYWVWVPRLVGV